MRKPRYLRLSAPLVITIAAGCAPSQPAAEPVPGHGPIHNPPPTRLEPPPPSGNGRVEKQPDGSCLEYADTSVALPKGVNPPPPHPVRCP